MNIFQKDCPQCAARHAGYTPGCACGYSFGPQRMEGAVEALELVAEEEQLYLDYLGARLEQARHAVASAATDLKISAASVALWNRPQTYIDTLRSAEAEFAAQAERVEQAKQAVARARNTELGPSSDQNSKQTPESRSTLGVGRRRGASREQLNALVMDLARTLDQYKFQTLRARESEARARRMTRPAISMSRAFA